MEMRVWRDGAFSTTTSRSHQRWSNFRTSSKRAWLIRLPAKRFGSSNFKLLNTRREADILIEMHRYNSRSQNLLLQRFLEAEVRKEIISNIKLEEILVGFKNQFFSKSLTSWSSYMNQVKILFSTSNQRRMLE